MLEGFDLPVVHEFRALFTLFLGVQERVIAPFPVEVRDLVNRAKFGGGIAMALQTERHAKRLGVLDFVHLIDLTMAFDAGNAARDVNGVIKIDVVRNLVDLDPRNGCARGRAFPDERQLRIVLEHLVMAVHASGTGRNVGEPRLLDVAMAIAAIQTELVDVDRVGKSDRLHRLITDASVFGRGVIPHAANDGGADQTTAENNHQRQLVGPFGKNG